MSGDIPQKARSDDGDETSRSRSPVSTPVPDLDTDCSVQPPTPTERFTASYRNLYRPIGR